MPQYLLRIKGGRGSRITTSMAVDSTEAEKDVRRRYPDHSEQIIDICRAEDTGTPKGISLDTIEDPSTDRVRDKED